MRFAFSSLAAVLATGLAACASCSSEQSATSDGQGAADASPDVHRIPIRDAGADAPIDPCVPVPPVIPDGGVNPMSVGTWVPGPTCCGTGNFVMAADPQASVKPLSWTACVSKRPGCQTLAVDWNPWRDRGIVFPSVEPVQLAGGTPYMVDYRDYSNDPLGLSLDAYLIVVEKLDGTRMLAAGEFVQPKLPNACGANVVVGSPGVFMELTGTDLTRRSFAWSPWNDLHTFRTSTFSTAQLGFNAQVEDVWTMGVNGTTAFLGFASTAIVDAIDLGSGALTMPQPRTAIASPRAVSDGALTAVGNGLGIDLMRPDGSWTQLLKSTAPHFIADFSVDRAMGQQIAWVEADTTGSGCGGGILWTSPYAATPQGIAKRKVAAVNDPLGRCGIGLVANAGVVLTLTDVNKAQITRLSDGMGWVIPAEASDDFSQPLWVDDNEAWIATGPSANTTGGWTSYTGILRIQRPALGPPTVPPGL